MIEKELKYKILQVEKVQFEEILGFEIFQCLEALEQKKTLTMVSEYFDTEQHELKEKQISLRRRLENRDSILNLKMAAQNLLASEEKGLFQRKEWEINLQEQPQFKFELQQGLNIKALKALLNLNPEELDLLSQIQHKPLILIAKAQFVRKCQLFEYQNNMVEIAVDQGYFGDCAKAKPFYEVEVELKRGKEQCLLDLAAKMDQIPWLEAEAESKFIRSIL